LDYSPVSQLTDLEQLEVAQAAFENCMITKGYSADNAIIVGGSTDIAYEYWAQWLLDNSACRSTYWDPVWHQVTNQ